MRNIKSGSEARRCVGECILLQSVVNYGVRASGGVKLRCFKWCSNDSSVVFNYAMNPVNTSPASPTGDI